MGEVERLNVDNEVAPSGVRTAMLRRGHWRSLALLEDTPAVITTLERYERAIGQPVYLRPTNDGLTVMSLDSSAPALVGVGGSHCCIDALPPTVEAVEAAAAQYRAKVAMMRRESVEERYLGTRIRKALATRLELGDDLLFLHQEWRFPGAGKVDLLAADRQTGQLVVIEAKKGEGAALRERDARGRSASEQAAEYVTQLVAYAAECEPFLQRVIDALAKVYRPEEPGIRLDLGVAPRWEVWWPEGRRRQGE
jgi:hypothetical protein